MSVSKTNSKRGPYVHNARCVRYRTIRGHRRRVGFVWAIFAAIVLLGAWDMAGRMDEVTYTVSSVR
jgi:hypothetical protein